MTGEPEDAGRDTSAEVAEIIQRADLLDDLGHHAEAADELRDALRLEPDNAEALATLAMVQLGAGRVGHALESARAAVATAPDHLLGGVVLGHVLAELGRKDEAVAAAERMLAVEPGSWLRQVEFATVVRRVRNGQDALDAARRAVHLAPDEPECHLALAAVAADLGLTDVARRSREEALRLDPRATDPGRGRCSGLRLRAARPTAPDEMVGETAERPARSRSGVTRVLALGALYAWGGPLVVAAMMLVGVGLARLVGGVVAALGIVVFGTAQASLPDGPLPLLRSLGRLDRLLAAACVAVLAAPAMLLLFALTGWPWPLGALILLGAFAFAALAVRATDITRINAPKL